MRFEDKFPGQATAQVALAKIIALMELGLENLSKINEGEDARVSRFSVITRTSVSDYLAKPISQGYSLCFNRYNFFVFTSVLGISEGFGFQ